MRTSELKYLSIVLQDFYEDYVDPDTSREIIYALNEVLAFIEKQYDRQEAEDNNP